MPDTQPCRSHASCPSVLSLLEMLRFSARLAKVHHDNSAPHCPDSVTKLSGGHAFITMLCNREDGGLRTVRPTIELANCACLHVCMCMHA